MSQNSSQLRFQRQVLAVGKGQRVCRINIQGDHAVALNEPERTGMPAGSSFQQNA